MLKCPAGSEKLRHADLAIMPGNPKSPKVSSVTALYAPPCPHTLPAEALDLNIGSSPCSEQSPPQEWCQPPSPIQLLVVFSLMIVFWQYQIQTDSYEWLRFN